MALEKSRQDMMVELVKTADYKAFSKACGTALAQAVALLLIEEELKCQDKKGNYSPGKTAVERARVQLTDASVFKLKDVGELKSLKDRLAILLGEDAQKLNRRAVKANSLYAKVANGQLAQAAQQRLEPEENYYEAPQEAPENVAAEKARAWFKAGAQGADTAAIYDRVFAKYATDGNDRFPGVDDTVLTAIWKKLVKNAPEHRLPSLDTAYPSSFAGRCLLNQLLGSLGGVRLPPRGMSPLVWQGYALYWFATIMSIQPFPDGNKRVARAVYAILMTRAGIDFVAPSRAYGAELAGM